MGDIDGDGDRGTDDQTFVSTSANQVDIDDSSGKYHAEADINRDGTVDSTDSAFMSTTAGALPLGALSKINNTIGYCGYKYEYPTVQYHVRFRDFDPFRGRWLQRDPAGYMDSNNLYGYIAGNPVGWTDPLGLDGYGSGTVTSSDPTQFGSMVNGQQIGIAFLEVGPMVQEVEGAEFHRLTRAETELIAQLEAQDLASRRPAIEQRGFWGSLGQSASESWTEVADATGYIVDNPSTLAGGWADLHDQVTTSLANDALSTVLRENGNDVQSIESSEITLNLVERLIGVNGMTEMFAGIDRATGQGLNSWERVERGALGLSQYSGIAAVVIMPVGGVISGANRVTTVAGVEANTIPPQNALSIFRVASEGELFIRYETANVAFSRITANGVLPGTYAAPFSDGLVPLANRAAMYNLPRPDLLRTNVFIIRVRQGTVVIGPKPVAGGLGNEVIFPFGAFPP